MGLQPGTSVGPYEIVGSLGAGGMGEVYRARDARLKRDVALKILPPAFAADPDRLARFQREAEVLASLNHPNIAGIHGLEETSTGRALVLELVEGQTLAERIARGPVPFDEALNIAAQIAEALEAAHEHGIIHRDLKPANVKLRPDGTVKVLDFGLAKLAQQTEVPHNTSTMSLSPTITTPALATGVGVLMGTAAYMSPEQAKGRPTDARSDIWSFGCVLFELVTGTRAFAGDDISDTIASVLRGDPEWSNIPASTPRGFTRLLKRCLARDRRQRLHSVGDARLDIQELLTPSADAVEPSVAAGPTLARRVLPLVVTAVVGAAVGHGVWLLRSEPAPPTQRFAIALPPGDAYSNTGRHMLALSPAGTRVVYSAHDQLNVRAFDQLASTPLRGTELGGRAPFFSADGEWVGFWRDAQLMKVAVSGGGAAVRLCAADNPTGAWWGDDGTILFGQGTKGIMRVSGDGGTPDLIVKVQDGASAHGPQLLPGGDWILFTLRAKDVNWDDASIVAQSISSGERRVLLQGGRDARYLPTGHLVYARTGTLFGVPFDVNRLQTTGGAVPLVEGVLDGRSTTGASQFSWSPNGTLVYVGGWQDAPTGRPVWVTRDGREGPPVTSAALEALEHPRLSPEGRRLALIVAGDVWVYDLEGRPPIRLTQDGVHYAPLWTPDGQRVIYESETPAPLRSVPADGSGGTPVPVSPAGHYHGHVLTGDGRVLIATDVDGETTGRDTDIVRVQLGDKLEPQALVVTKNREGWDGVALSPDGRWMAYATDATGQQEVWVQPYPGPGAPVRVSPNGGREPVWARSGNELYYLEGRKLMAVTFEARTTFDFKPASLLFELPYTISNQPPSYDVGPDGRFVMIKPTEGQREAEPIVVVLNWFEELKRRVPLR
jgi:serine/threonine-protein kinase